MNTPRVGSLTPWGVAQFVTERAPGVVAVSTSRHGGLWVSPDVLKKIPAVLLRPSDFYPMGGQGWGASWFEEDCEAARVVVGLPEVFGAEAVKAARRSLKAFHPTILDAFDNAAEHVPSTEPGDSPTDRTLGEL